jgi:cytochrome c
MDKMTINMIAGAVLSSLLVLFGTNTFIDIIYPRGGTPEAPVETAETAAPGEAAGGGASQPLPVLLASAKVDAGASQAKKCTACHGFEQGGPNKIGPNLHGVVGRPVASHEGFAYSEALKAFGGNWDYEKLNCFIKDPKACVAGTKMAFAGVKKDTDRADVIVYLRSVSPDAPALPAAQEAAAAPAPPHDAGAAPAPAQDAGAASGGGPVTGGGNGPGQAGGEAPAEGPQAKPDTQGATQ